VTRKLGKKKTILREKKKKKTHFANQLNLARNKNAKLA
jgi:hypothetical protein